MATQLDIGRTMYTLLKSYQSGGSQRVIIDDVFLYIISVLGPILFLIYIIFLCQIAQTQGLNAHFYADDTQLYMAFEPID